MSVELLRRSNLVCVHHTLNMAEQRHTAKVSPPPHLNVQMGSAEWKLFKPMWDNYVIVARLDNEAADYKKALLLHTPHFRPWQTVDL